MWGSFRGRFGDHFRVGDHFGVGIISGAVQYFYQLYHQMFVKEFHSGIFIAKGTEGCIFHEKV